MIRTTALALASLLALGACGDNADTTTSGNTTAAAPVAATAPPAGQSWVDTVTKTPEGGYMMGNPNAPVKLVEFGSRTCHVCAAFDEEGFEPLKAKYVSTGKVSYEFRDYLRNAVDIAAMLLGQCAGTGPYFAMLDQTMKGQAALLTKAEAIPQSEYTRIAALPQNQQYAAFADQLGLVDFFKQRGLPEPKARQCLTDVATAEAVTKMNAEATQRYSIPGTPTFLINGEVVPNTVNWEQLEPKLRAAGA